MPEIGGRGVVGTSRKAKGYGQYQTFAARGRSGHGNAHRGGMCHVTEQFRHR